MMKLCISIVAFVTILAMFAIRNLFKEIQYLRMLLFFYTISNGFRDEWEKVEERLKSIENNPYPNVSKEEYETERERQKEDGLL